MLRIIALIAAITLLTGCLPSPKYNVKMIEDKFSESAALTYYSERNLVADVPIMGETHFGSHGLYINPMVKRGVNGEVSSITLRIKHESGFPEKQEYARLKNIGRIISVVFRTNDKTVIELRASAIKSALMVREMSNSSSQASFAIVSITQEEFKNIATADTISIKVSGSMTDTIYEDEEINASFKENMRSFYTQYIIGNAPEIK